MIKDDLYIIMFIIMVLYQKILAHAKGGPRSCFCNACLFNKCVEYIFTYVCNTLCWPTKSSHYCVYIIKINRKQV